MWLQIKTARLEGSLRGAADSLFISSFPKDWFSPLSYIRVRAAVWHTELSTNNHNQLFLISVLIVPVLGQEVSSITLYSLEK